MSEVARLELSKRLWELSGWKKTSCVFVHLDGVYDRWDLHDRGTAKSYNKSEQVPAYSLGYLIRKLSPCQIIASSDGMYWASWNPAADEIEERANSPENATCKLAIELFEQGILKREDQS
jgi:hypothetical protein